MSEKKQKIDELENFLSDIECVSGWLMQDQIREVAEKLYYADYCKQTKGEWVFCPRWHDYEVDTYTCSRCGKRIREEEKQKMKYCPNCGARMKGGE